MIHITPVVVDASSIAAPTKHVGPVDRVIDVTESIKVDEHMALMRARTRKKAMKRRERRIAKKLARMSSMQLALHNGGVTTK